MYKTFLIYRTCMRRAPAKPVRACTLRKWCPVAHVTFEAPLRTSHFSLHSSHSTLHTALFTLHTAFFALHTSHFTLHSSHSTCHTSHSTLHTSHFSLLSSHSTLHTALFTPRTSHCTLHTPHFISPELFSPYPSSSHLMCHLSFHESLPSTATKELACAVHQPGPCVGAFLRSCCCGVVSKNMTCARPRCNATSSKHFPHTSHCILQTSHLSSFHLVSCTSERLSHKCTLHSLHRVLPTST